MTMRMEILGTSCQVCAISRALSNIATWKMTVCSLTAAGCTVIKSTLGSLDAKDQDRRATESAAKMQNGL